MRLFIKRLLSYYPTRLPVGLTEFHKWSQDVVDLCDDLDSVPLESKQFVLSSQFQSLPPAAAYKPKHYFVKILYKAAANQVAAQVFVGIKEAQKQREIEEAAARAASEAETAAQETTAPGVD